MTFAFRVVEDGIGYRFQVVQRSAVNFAKVFEHRLQEVDSYIGAGANCHRGITQCMACLVCQTIQGLRVACKSFRARRHCAFIQFDCEMTDY